MPYTLILCKRKGRYSIKTLLHRKPFFCTCPHTAMLNVTLLEGVHCAASKCLPGILL